MHKENVDNVTENADFFRRSSDCSVKTTQNLEKMFEIRIILKTLVKKNILQKVNMNILRTISK